MKNTSKVIGAAKQLRPVPPSPPVAPPKPHPFQLNSHESHWQRYAHGPVDGWFAFSQHGNPPFGVPVQVAYDAPATNGEAPVRHVCVGVRTKEILPVLGKERWEIYSEFPLVGNGLLFWRFLSFPP